MSTLDLVIYGIGGYSLLVLLFLAFWMPLCQYMSAQDPPEWRDECDDAPVKGRVS